MHVRMTYQYKLYDNKQNRYLDQAINIAAEIWNHCIAFHRRYYRMFGKHLPANRLKVFLAKLKRREKYAHWNLLGSQVRQSGCSGHPGADRQSIRCVLYPCEGTPEWT